MKKLMYWLMGAVFVVAGYSQESAAADKPAATPRILKISANAPKDRSYSKAWFAFAEAIEKKSGGTLKGQVFTDGVLGGDRQALEAMQMGTVDMACMAPGPIASYSPRFEVFDLPFLFKDKATAFRVLDGPIGQEVLADLPAIKLVGLGYWENGFRHLTNSRREVKTAEDIKGLKVRTLESKVHVDSWKLMGANPTPMSFTQLFTALEQRVVDGQENPYGIVVTSKLDEVQKYLTSTGHVYNALVVMMSKATWDSLSDKEREIIKSTAEEMRDYQRKLNEEEDQKSVVALKGKGMKLSDLNPGEKEKLRAIVQPVYDR